MGALGEEGPKCLSRLTLQGETVLGRQLTALEAAGVTDILITTGPFEEQIVSFVAEHFPQLSVEYVNNPLFAETGYIYSLYLAQAGIDVDVLLLHGDLVFDAVVIHGLLDADEEDLVLIDEHAELPEKDFKGRIQDGIVTEIGVDLSGDDCRFLLPAYKLSKRAMRRWLDEMARFIGRGEAKVYAEDAFNEISRELGVKPLRFAGFCMEIDTPDDLERARHVLGGG